MVRTAPMAKRNIRNSKLFIPQKVQQKVGPLIRPHQAVRGAHDCQHTTLMNLLPHSTNIRKSHLK